MSAPARVGGTVRDVGTTGPRGGLRRALRVEIALQRDALVGTSTIATIVLAIALPGFGRLGGILLALALWTPYMLAMGDGPDRWAARAELGISRADRVRARTVLVVMLQAALSAVVVLILQFGPPRTRATDGEMLMMTWHAMGLGISLPMPTAQLWADVMTWLPALVITHLWVGREALRRASTWVLLGSGATFVLAYGTVMMLPPLLVHVLPGLADQIVMGGVDGEPVGGGSLTFETLRAIVGAAVLVLALGALAWRAGTWARRA